MGRSCCNIYLPLIFILLFVFCSEVQCVIVKAQFAQDESPRLCTQIFCRDWCLRDLFGCCFDQILFLHNLFCALIFQWSECTVRVLENPIIPTSTIDATFPLVLGPPNPDLELHHFMRTTDISAPKLCKHLKFLKYYQHTQLIYGAGSVCRWLLRTDDTSFSFMKHTSAIR